MQYDWKKIINSQKESTLTVKEFCRQNNICVSSFYKSKRRLTSDCPEIFIMQFDHPVGHRLS